MRKRFKVTCPKCGGHSVCGWYDERGLIYHVKCAECGNHHEVVNLKYVEAFPDWFEVSEEEVND